MQQLYLSLAVFVGSHFLMSHPLRAMLVKSLGSNGFQGLYSVVSLASFVWAIFAYRALPDAAPLWSVGEGSWWVATALMLVGSILFVGSMAGNPALPAPGAERLAQGQAKGVLAITRHPMMWGFALWGIVHLLASPQPKLIVLSVAMIFLALVGSMGQDAKKAVLMGSDWKGWVSRTSFIPFAGQLTGRSSWAAAMPGRTVLLLGVAVWLLASRAHPWLGQPLVGIWRWL